MQGAAPTPSAQEPQRSEAPPSRPLDAGTLRSVYLDLLGRPPFDSERSTWLGRGRGELVADLLASEDSWQHWWEEQLFYFLLIDNFRPATRTAQAVPKQLAKGSLHVRDALHRIALTPTFDLRNPGADTFVTVVLEQMCGVTVQREKRTLEAGKRAYDGGKAKFLGDAARSQADVIRIAVEHERATRHFVAREYGRILRQELEKSELDRLARTLHEDPTRYSRMLQGWLLSEAYDRRLATPAQKSNRVFVRALFVDLLGRLPEQDEVEPMRNALDGLADSRPLRSVLVKLLLDSQETELPERGQIGDSALWVSGLFERLLGRTPSAEELATFTEVLAEKACQPRTVLYALLTNREYNLY